MRKSHRHIPTAKDETSHVLRPNRPSATPAQVSPTQAALRVGMGHSLSQFSIFPPGQDPLEGLNEGHSLFGGQESAAHILAAAHTPPHQHTRKHEAEVTPHSAPPKPEQKASKPNFGHNFAHIHVHTPTRPEEETHGEQAHGPFGWLQNTWHGMEQGVADAVGPLPSWHQLREAAGEQFAPLVNALSVPEAFRAEGHILQSGMRQNAAGVRNWGMGLEAGVDRQEDDWTRQNAGGHGVTPDAYGHVMPDIPSQIEGGLEKGALGLVSGLAGVVADPWDAAGGLWSLAEHVPTVPVPGVGGNAFREAHALERVAAAGRDGKAHHAAMEDLHGDALHPGRHNGEDAAFLKAAWAGATEPYDRAGEAGKPWEAGSRLGLDVVSFLVGGGEARAGVTAAKSGQVVNDLDRAGDAANDLGKVGHATHEAAHAGELGKAGDMAKTGDDLKNAGGVVRGGKAAEQHLIEQTLKKFQELEEQANPKLEGKPGYLSKTKRGTVLSGILDTQDPAGQVHFGLNNFTQQPPEGLHPLLQERLNIQKKLYETRKAEADAKEAAGLPLSPEEKGVQKAGIPGFHSEVYALDASLKAREARTGVPISPDDLNEFLLHNISIKGGRVGGVPYRCFNCSPITEGVSLTSPLQESENLYHQKPTPGEGAPAIQGK